MMRRKSCPACEGTALNTLFEQASIPAQSVVLLDTEAEARAFPTGSMALTVCRSCGFLFNAVFEPDLIDYAAMTEESQHFSGTFNRFAKELVAEIGARRPLDGKLTLEVGCGKGDFLEELVRATGTRAIGVDPGYRADRRLGDAPTGDIRFRREYFDPDLIDEVPDLVVCRHTLEHIAEVLGFMRDVVRAMRGNASADVMFETPDAARVLREGAFWDIYHEHCSYFTIGSHARLFRRVGLDVTGSYLGFGGQYIIQYARPGSGEPRPEERDLDDVLALAEAFPAKVAEVLRYWRDFVGEAHRRGQPVAIWGGGSKCVSFLSGIGASDEIGTIVDINVYKQGKFIPGTGHEVVAPERLKDNPPELVIVMNPLYVEEIRASLADMGLGPTVLAL